MLFSWIDKRNVTTSVQFMARWPASVVSLRSHTKVYVNACVGVCVCVRVCVCVSHSVPASSMLSKVFKQVVGFRGICADKIFEENAFAPFGVRKECREQVREERRSGSVLPFWHPMCVPVGLQK